MDTIEDYINKIQDEEIRYIFRNTVYKLDNK